jgi:hypothetical protein
VVIRAAGMIFLEEVPVALAEDSVALAEEVSAAAVPVAAGKKVFFFRYSKRTNTSKPIKFKNKHAINQRVTSLKKTNFTWFFPQSFVKKIIN